MKQTIEKGQKEMRKKVVSAFGYEMTGWCIYIRMVTSGTLILLRSQNADGSYGEDCVNLYRLKRALSYAELKEIATLCVSKGRYTEARQVISLMPIPEDTVDMVLSMHMFNSFIK